MPPRPPRFCAASPTAPTTATPAPHGWGKAPPHWPIRCPTAGCCSTAPIPGSTVSALLLANADGSDPAELFRTADVIRADMADSQWLYIERYAAEDDAAQNALYRLPLDGGEPEWLMDLEMGQNTSAGVIGCLGRELIYYSFDWGDDTVPPEAMNWTAEEWEAWDASQTGTHKVEAINVDTGARRQLAAWTSHGGSAGYACAVFDGMLYRTPDNAQGDLLVTDIASGSERTVKIQWPFALEQASVGPNSRPWRAGSCWWMCGARTATSTASPWTPPPAMRPS